MDARDTPASLTHSHGAYWGPLARSSKSTIVSPSPDTVDERVSDDLKTAPSRPAHRELPWISLWAATSLAAVLVAIALPGWLEIGPWRATVTGDANLIGHFHVTSTYSPERTVVTIVALVLGLIVATLVSVGVRELARGRSRRDEAPTATALSASRRGVRYLATANALLVVGGVGIAAYLDANGHPFGWRAVVAFNFANYIPSSAGAIQGNLAPVTWVEAPISSSAARLIVGGVILVALITVIGWSRLRLKRAKASKFVPFAVAAALMALVVAWLERSQLGTIPQYYIARYPKLSSGVLNGHTVPLNSYKANNVMFTHAGYGVALVGLGLFVIVELVILAALLIDVGVLAARRRVSPRNTLPVVVVRDLTVVVAASVLILTVASLIAV